MGLGVLGWGVWLGLGVGWAQEVAPAARDRFSFAELYLGADVRLLSTALTSETAAGMESGLSPLWSASPRLWIGGMHFWGHADFFVAFAIPPQVGETAPEDGGLTAQQLFQSVETGGKVYPLALRPGTARPWLGASWSPVSYQQTDPVLGAGPLQGAHGLQLSAGLSARTGAHTVSLGGGMLPIGMTYPVSTTRTASLAWTTWSAALVYTRSFDTTLSARAAVAEGAVAAHQERLDRAGALSAWSVAVGPSSAFTLGEDAGPRTYAGAPPGSIFADVAVGHYWHGLDAEARLGWRRIAQSAEGYDTARSWLRHAISVDMVKMFLDYQGFVPFVGPAVGINGLTYTEAGVSHQGWVVRPEVVFGWDIRPTRTQSFLLRTNLRYTPWLTLDTPGARFQHLEFNFIQLVVYPERFRVP